MLSAFEMIWQDMWHIWGENRYRLGVVQKFVGHRPYRTPRHRRYYNTKMEIGNKMGCLGLDCFGCCIISLKHSQICYASKKNI